jgi:hypothetical protein
MTAADLGGTRRVPIPLRVTGAYQHYLPAVLIGGFGRLPAGSGPLREAEVAVRDRATGVVDRRVRKAKTLAARPRMYRLASPPPGVDPDIVDTVWNGVENALRDLVGRLTNRRLQPGDDQLLFAYAAEAGVRHPTFGALAAHHHASHGLAAPYGDALQYTRLASLGKQISQMPDWRWRVLHSPHDCRRFMLTDRGWIYVQEPEIPSYGLFFPMGLRVAILGYLDDPPLPPRRPPFEEHFDLCDSMIEWFNAAPGTTPTSRSSSPTPVTVTGSPGFRLPGSPAKRVRAVPLPAVPRPVRLGPPRNGGWVPQS